MIEKLKLYEDEIFYTVMRLPFSYKIVKGNSVEIFRDGKRINRIIPITDFEKALRFNPSKPSDITNKVQGSSYVYAIIKDKRFI